MNLSQFFDHWRISENPFRGEEARHDSVLARLAASPPPGGADPARELDDARAAVAGITSAHRHGVAALHSDFEKILGSLERPAASIVFGEKGSGKTAIRLQIGDRVNLHNTRHPHDKILLLPYDDLNAMLDRFHQRAGGKDPVAALSRFRLVDHLDAILSIAVTRLTDALLGRPTADPAVDLGMDARRVGSRFDRSLRRQALLLQAIYDAAPDAAERTARVRRRLRVPRGWSERAWSLLAWAGWALPAGGFAWAEYAAPPGWREVALVYGVPVLTLPWVLALARAAAVRPLLIRRLARRVRRQMRTTPRSLSSLWRSLRQVPARERAAGPLPLTDAEETRYALLDGFRRVMRALGYAGMIVVVDRVDEPRLISGDPDRMRALIWPLLNNKLLQQEGLGIKLLLPIELRHALFKESSAFFHEVRLDKQNFIERLSWTGAMLYDLCDARLQACRAPGAPPITLLDLFAEDVSRRDLVDALDQMHQPRDAFKFLYQCMLEHCSNVTREQGEYRIPRLVLESVRKQQSERVQQLYRGIRPA